MAFWSSPDGITPKQSHKWIVQFGDKNELTFLAKSVDRPSYTIGSTQGKLLYSHTINFPNRVKWNPITIVLYDARKKEALKTTSADIQGRIRRDQSGLIISTSTRTETIKNLFSTEYFFYDLLQEAGYENPAGQNNGLAKYAFKESLTQRLLGGGKSLNIKEVLDNGSKQEEIKIYNPFISDFKFGALDYASDQVLTITLTINYDWAEFVSIKDITSTSPKVTLNQKPLDATIKVFDIKTPGYAETRTEPYTGPDIGSAREGQYGQARLPVTSLGADIAANLPTGGPTTNRIEPNIISRGLNPSPGNIRGSDI
jgi:hypothetical protein